ncbi:MAG: desulfoferrodoxin [Candidatus Bathyarchaeota archaeon]|nr:desulfoferrodoxin [Candidatus Bathyarchaeota archaeon]
MTERNQVWKCEICGNIVEVLHEGVGQLVCCGQPMNLMEAKKTEAGGYEKHLPVIEVKDNKVHVKVGSVEHPMMDAHWIEWIAVDTEDGVLRKYLNPGEKPVAVFKTGKKVLRAREYCNLHGHWATDV